MTIQPSFDPMRHRNGRFAEHHLAPVEDIDLQGTLDLGLDEDTDREHEQVARDLLVIEQTTEAEALVAPVVLPGEVIDRAQSGKTQASAHWMIWKSTLNDYARANAARQALRAHLSEHRWAPPNLPPGDDAVALVEDAMNDDGIVLDAAQRIGPVSHPQDRMYGAMLAGEVYDRATLLRQERDLAREAAAADDVLPRESETSRAAADVGNRDPQPPFEYCRPCGGHGYHEYPDFETGEARQDYCNSCGGMGREDLLPVTR